MFLTRFTYDSFGRMKSIRYPDGEWVQYAYTTGGLLKSVIGQKQNRQHVYLQNRRYDEQGRKTFQQNGNGVCTRYTYDAHRQWMNTLQTELPNDNIIQNIQYEYDNVGNITGIYQLASSDGLGGEYTNTYSYDKQYRLTESNGVGKFPYSFEAIYSPSGRLGIKNTSTNQWTSNLLYGYNKSTLPHMTHQPQTVYDSGKGTMNHFWDANGNLAQVVDCNHNAARLHEWDEENRLRFVLGEKYAGYYGYDANGERVYKLTGSSSMDDVNSGPIIAQAIFDDAVLYPNPYIVVSSKEYTKHYYAGTERLATVIGGGGFLDLQTPIVPLTSQHDMDIVESFSDYYLNEDPFNYQQIIRKSEPTEDIFGNGNPDLEYQCKPTELVMVDILNPQDILLKSISINDQNNGPDKEVYFYHGDHLGSANWITDADGNPIQYIHYAPYGELIANQQPIGYDERFKFTGKERDWETGYDYFGARFYDYRKGFWNSVDPLADKYPNVTPYLYCNGNPIMLVDPNGRAAYYTNMGAYLGTDKDGFTGNVYISTAEDFEYLKDMNNVSAGISTMPLQIADLSSEAYSNIYTDILTRSGFDIARTLLNGKISVINGTDLYNNPECNRQSTLANATTTISSKDGKVVNVSYRITANQNNALFKRTCGTIEGIISVLGVHEFIGHIMKGYGDASGTHCIIYALQMIDASWEKLPLEYQNMIRKNFQIYYTKEILNVIFGK